VVKIVTLHREAERELLQAVAFYENRRRGLGSEFEQAVRALAAALPSNPQRYPVQAHGTRRALMKRFPYVIHFMDLPDEIWIVAIAHTKRSSGYWHDRLGQ
jgi:toxin ParE1/3/4